VDELDRHRTLADRRCDAFDRPMTDVAGEEDTGMAALEEVRVSVEFPPGAAAAAGEDVRPGHEEAVFIAAQPAFRAARGGLAPDQNEQRVGPDLARYSCPAVSEQQALQLPVTHGAHDGGVGEDSDRRMLLESLYQVLRHLLRERRAADDERHRARVRRGVQRGLPRRVGSADDEDVAAPVEDQLAGRRAVVDPGADQLVDPVRIEPAVMGAGCSDDCPAVDDGAAR